MMSRNRTRYPLKTRQAPQPPPRALRGANPQELSLVASFDDHLRNAAILSQGCENEFATFVKKTALWIKELRKSEMKREQLNQLIKEKEKEILAKDYKIKQARQLVEDESRFRRQAEMDRDSLAKQLQMLKDIIMNDGGRGIDNETLEKVRCIDTTNRKNSPVKGHGLNLPPVEESVESLLDVSDLSFDETRDDLGESRLRNGQPRYKRRSSGKIDMANKRRKSRSLGNKLEDKILSTTTKVTVDKEGNAHAESIIEAVPVKGLAKMKRKSRESRGERKVTYNERDFQQEFSPSAPPCPDFNDGARCWNRAQQVASPPGYSPLVRRHLSNASTIPSRPHVWETKRGMPKDCGPCGIRIQFNREYLRCKECSAICHRGCKADVPVPCVPAGCRTPTNKTQGNTLADLAPRDPPYIPALLRHCIREVETRGLEEVGIYRIPGNEADANEVLEKFMRGRGAPILSKYEIHVVASTVKKFLRSLKEPIIPSSLWKRFVDAASAAHDDTYEEGALYQAISELLPPNRDTLAFLILHLQRVAESPHTKMDVENLSNVWGPTIVGNSSHDPAAIMSEPPLQKAVVKALMNISSDYWEKFLQVEPPPLFPVLNTPEEQGERLSIFPSARKTGPIAKRTRSRLYKPQIFQSPMLK